MKDVCGSEISCGEWVVLSESHRGWHTKLQFGLVIGVDKREVVLRVDDVGPNKMSIFSSKRVMLVDSDRIPKRARSTILASL